MQRTLIIQWFVYISIHSPCQAVYTAKQQWRDGGVGKNIVDVHSGWCSGKSSACQCRSCERCGFDLWVGKIPWSRKWQPTPVFLPRKSHAQRSLASYSPWGCKESDTTEQLSSPGLETCLCGDFLPPCPRACLSTPVFRMSIVSATVQIQWRWGSGGVC